jgi:hypothetical protein
LIVDVYNRCVEGAVIGTYNSNSVERLLGLLEHCEFIESRTLKEKRSAMAALSFSFDLFCEL